MKWAMHVRLANPMIIHFFEYKNKGKPSRVNKLKRKLLLQKALICNQNLKIRVMSTIKNCQVDNSTKKEISNVKLKQTKKEAKVSRPTRPRAKK